jgi:hypothetical protein
LSLTPSQGWERVDGPAEIMKTPDDMAGSEDHVVQHKEQFAAPIPRDFPADVSGSKIWHTNPNGDVFHGDNIVGKSSGIALDMHPDQSLKAGKHGSLINEGLSKANSNTQLPTHRNAPGSNGSVIAGPVSESKVQITTLSEVESGGEEVYMAGDQDEDTQVLPGGGKKVAHDPAVYKAGEDEDDGILFSNSAAWNKFSVVLRDAGTLRFVKYVSQAAKGDRWDIKGEVEISEEGWQGLNEEDEDKNDNDDNDDDQENDDDDADEID